jgi:histidinol-phosphate aminotransferase
VRPIYEALKERRILVRYMKYDDYGDGLRLSVGGESDIERLVTEIAPLVLRS